MVSVLPPALTAAPASRHPRLSFRLSRFVSFPGGVTLTGERSETYFLLKTTAFSSLVAMYIKHTLLLVPGPGGTPSRGRRRRNRRRKPSCTSRRRWAEEAGSAGRSRRTRSRRYEAHASRVPSWQPRYSAPGPLPSQSPSEARPPKETGQVVSTRLYSVPLIPRVPTHARGGSPHPWRPWHSTASPTQASWAPFAANSRAPRSGRSPRGTRPTG